MNLHGLASDSFINVFYHCMMEMVSGLLKHFFPAMILSESRIRELIPLIYLFIHIKFIILSPT